MVRAAHCTNAWRCNYTRAVALPAPFSSGRGTKSGKQARKPAVRRIKTATQPPLRDGGFGLPPRSPFRELEKRIVPEREFSKTIFMAVESRHCALRSSNALPSKKFNDFDGLIPVTLQTQSKTAGLSMPHRPRSWSASAWASAFDGSERMRTTYTRLSPSIVGTIFAAALAVRSSSYTRSASFRLSALARRCPRRA